MPEPETHTEYEAHVRLYKRDSWDRAMLPYTVDLEDRDAVVKAVEEFIETAPSMYEGADYRVVEILRTVVWTGGA